MSSSAVPITVAVVISLLFCSIRAYYWYRARARPPPYSSDSAYDIENQAIISGGGGSGQPPDHRPSSLPGTAGTAYTNVTRADHHAETSPANPERKNAVAIGKPVSRPSSPLYHAVIRTVSFPTQQKPATATALSAPAAGTIVQKSSAGNLASLPADTAPISSPNGSPCVSSTVSQNNSCEVIHPPAQPSKPPSSAKTSPASTATPSAPVPGLIQTAVSGSWLSMLKHQKYRRVTSPTTPTLTSPSPLTFLPVAPHATTAGNTSDSTTVASAAASPSPAPPMLVVQPCTPRPFAFHAPSPTSPLPTSTAPAAAPISKSRTRPHVRRRKSVGHGAISLFRQMYAATPPLVETDEESEEEEEGEGENGGSKRTGSGTSILSETGDSFADSLAERGRLLPAGGGKGKACRAIVNQRDVGNKKDEAGVGDKGQVAANGGTMDQLGKPAVGEQESTEMIGGSESGSLEENEENEENEEERGNEGEEEPITGAGSWDATNEDSMQRKSAAKRGGKWRTAAKPSGKGSASPKSVKSAKDISKKSKRSRRMSI